MMSFTKITQGRNTGTDIHTHLMSLVIPWPDDISLYADDTQLFFSFKPDEFHNSPY